MEQLTEKERRALKVIADAGETGIAFSNVAVEIGMSNYAFKKVLKSLEEKNKVTKKVEAFGSTKKVTLFTAKKGGKN